MSIKVVEALKLLCGPQSHVDADRLEMVATADLDWNALFLESLWHKVAFVVYERLVTTGLVSVALRSRTLPLLLLNHWKQLYAVNDRRNCFYLEHLDMIAASFDRLEVGYAVAKGGPILIGRVYTRSERKMYDLDIIAGRADLTRIVEAMSAAGFRLGAYDHATRALEPLAKEEFRKWLLYARGLPNFVKLIDDDIVDHLIAQVQFRIGSKANSSSSATESMLERSAIKNGIRRLDDVDVLVQLVLHIARETQDSEHQEWRMSWNLIKFCDLDRFAHDVLPGVGIPSFVDRVTELGFVQQCGYAFAVLNKVYPSPLTESVLADVANRGSGARAAIDQAHLLDVESLLTNLASSAMTNSKWTALVGSKTT